MFRDRPDTIFFVFNKINIPKFKFRFEFDIICVNNMGEFGGRD
jgi:hypothetical protein